MLLAAALSTTGLAATAAPAGATTPPCGASEDTYNRLACGPTDILVPAGKLLERKELMRAEHLYASRGFGRDFLWFAPERVVDPRGLRWAGCLPGQQSGGMCTGTTPGTHIAFDEVSDDLGGDRLSVFGDRDSFLARVCGNFPERPNERRYHPRLVGEKFHDRDDDGHQDVGEESLGGWQFRVTLVTPLFDNQTRGASEVVTTGADGQWSLDLQGYGPGTYRVEELPRDGWRVTNGAVREVSVPDGIGDAVVRADAFGNVRQTDSAKTGFEVVDAPPRLDADTPTDLTVRVALTNHGPTDAVDVTDVVTGTGRRIHDGLEDCTLSPARHVIRTRLAEGETKTFDVVFSATCTEPSDHRFTFEDVLTNDDDVQETHPADNSRTISADIPVWDASDLEVRDTALDCAASTTVRTVFTCTGTTSAVNAGPYGPTTSTVALALSGLDDCTSTARSSASLVAPLEVGETARLTTTWDVVCTDRSFHPFDLHASAAPTHVHVEDRDSSDDAGSAEDTTEVFEAVDLEVAVAGLLCSEREANRTASTCDATVVLTNDGPADAVQTLLDLDAVPGSGCVATPARVQLERTLAAGTSQTVTQRVELACTTAVRHEVRLDAWLRNAPTDPHAVDEDRDRLVWLPTDAKPRSFPSSVNVGKEGTLPFAVLSTADRDALTDVDTASLRYGATGTEDSVTGCKTQGEDVDGDGRLDLVCLANTQLAGITCSTTVLHLSGRLRDGTRFAGQDEIKVLGCQRSTSA